MTCTYECISFKFCIQIVMLSKYSIFLKLLLMYDKQPDKLQLLLKI